MKPPIGKSNEWYTPVPYVEAARTVLGCIDTDPSSCAFANETVKATRYYTQSDNGLMLPWIGRCFINPPFGKTESGQSLLKMFTTRLIQQYEAGICTEAILLIPVNTATRWFVPLWQYPICFPVKRIRFNTEVGKSDGAAFPTCLVYLGPQEEKFIEVFSKFGPVARGCGPQPARYDQPELFEAA
jgi:hypothetical protein